MLIQQNYFPELEHDSLVMDQLISTASIISRKNVQTILIEGESGAGKMAFAKYIHFNSNYNTNHFKIVRCSSMVEGNIEEVIFGKDFVTSDEFPRRQPGLIERSKECTLFIDEIESLPFCVQAKLLRYIEDGIIESYYREDIKAEKSQIIAATKEDLSTRVRQNLFRQDLYYRLSAVKLSVPALRERKSDIRVLVNYLIKNAQDNLLKYKTFDERAMDLIINYNWPGNFDQLRSVIEGVLILSSQQVITADDLPNEVRKKDNTIFSKSIIPDPIPLEGIDFSEMVSNFENELLMKALEQTRWVKNRAAQLLNLNRTTLVEKLKKKGIVEPD